LEIFEHTAGGHAVKFLVLDPEKIVVGKSPSQRDFKLWDNGAKNERLASELISVAETTAVAHRTAGAHHPKKTEFLPLEVTVSVV